MINKDEIIVIKNNEQVIIAFNGCKLIKPIDGLKDLSEEEVRDLFIKDVLGKEVK